jgi:hypothetical protein
MLSSAWQISPSEPKDWRSVEALSNLHLNNSLPIPSTTDLAPKTALVRIRAAAINARDVMVIAHGTPSLSYTILKSIYVSWPFFPISFIPSSLSFRLLMQLTDPIYPIANIPNLTPCADGAGEIIAAGPESVWKKGDRVTIHPMGWINEELPDLVGMKGKGAGNIQGTLRQFGVYVRYPSPLFLYLTVHGKILKNYKGRFSSPPRARTPLLRRPSLHPSLRRHSNQRAIFRSRAYQTRNDNSHSRYRRS